MNGSLRSRPSSTCQSNTAPRPPGRVASLGARASNRIRSATAAYPGNDARSAAVSTAIAFMTGNPNICLMSRSRATVSLPCNCRISGASASTILASVASSASTVSATLTARPLACLPSSRPISRLRWRGEGGKNTKPTVSAPASSATSSVSGVDRPQILTIRDMFQGTGQGGDNEANKRCACARVLQRRALLVSPGGAISAALRGGGKALRIVARGRHRAGAQIGQLRPRLPRIGLVLARGAPPVPLPEPGRRAARHHARDRDREDDKQQAQRNQDHGGEKLAHDQLSR